MKKILFIFFVFMSFAIGLYAQDAEKIVNLTMVDGIQLNMSLFKKWKDAGKFIKENNPSAGSVLIHLDTANGQNIPKVSDKRKSKNDWILSPVGFDAKTENAPGDLINKDYKENDNAIAAEILNTLKENDCEYGVGYINLGDKLSRYVVALKGKNLRVNRYNYYKASNKDWQEFIEQQLAKEVKTNKIIEGIAKSVFSPLIASASSSNGKSSEQTLYDLRHHTYEHTSVGSYQETRILILKYRYIYYDNGRQVFGYIVDLDGNIRSDTTLDLSRSDFGKPIVPKYSVPKEIRELAMKSLE